VKNVVVLSGDGADARFKFEFAIIQKLPRRVKKVDMKAETLKSKATHSISASNTELFVCFVSCCYCHASIIHPRTGFRLLRYVTQ
jgi:hypothetical protein